jgi:hypothetical protein
MNIQTKGTGVTRARIGTLKLRVGAGGRHSAKALALAVASRLATRVDALGALAGRENIHVTAGASLSRERVADSIVEQITSPVTRGRR